MRVQLEALNLPLAVDLDEVAASLLDELGLRKHPPISLVLAGMTKLGWSFRELVGAAPPLTR